MPQPAGSGTGSGSGSESGSGFGMGSDLAIELTPVGILGHSSQDSDESAADDREPPISRTSKRGFLGAMGMRSATRKTIGICFVLGTVLLWTLSNFMASFIFADQTYDKPFFLTYGTNIPFALATIPYFIRYLARRGLSGLRHDVGRLTPRLKPAAIGADEADEHLLAEDARDQEETAPREPLRDNQGLRLGPRETAAIALELCFPWLLSDYLSAACLAYTSVASVTILTSTSSIWTLVFCVIAGVESFSLAKSASVVASLVGIIIISSIDLSGENGGADPNRGSFPPKSLSQTAVGDAMAFFSAVIYGFTTTRLKKRVVSDDGNDMQLVLALAGLFSILLSWPLFFLLHWTGLETFELPPTGQIWSIVAFSWVSSYFGDVSWAYSLHLISPLVVSVGLSTTIPLSLVGEMIQYGQYSSFMYWVGASIVVLSFIFISVQGDQDAQEQKMAAAPASGGAISTD